MVRFAGTVSKRGHAPAECEDQWSAAAQRFAVADGATEASYSRVWARILTDSFCQTKTDGTTATVAAWLDAARAEWRRCADEISARQLPWFTREALRAGSFASLVGLSFPPETPDGWTAVSCGDACVFHVRDESLAAAIPFSDSRAFTNSPPLVPSVETIADDRFEFVTGTAQPGDAFYLITDALAQWFLAEHEHAGQPWAILDTLRTPEAFDAFVAEARESGALRNDDVALLSIALGLET
jgi:hypothetical protein